MVCRISKQASSPGNKKQDFSKRCGKLLRKISYSELERSAHILNPEPITYSSCHTARDGTYQDCNDGQHMVAPFHVSTIQEKPAFSTFEIEEGETGNFSRRNRSY